MAALSFEIVGRDGTTDARAGVIHTPHGTVHTPAFLPVGTQGSVKALSPRDLAGVGAEIVMTNAYHLALRPGGAVVADLGGLHRLTGWDGPLMTDSGGYQVFSLAANRQIDADGVTFRSHLDGTPQRFTPESVMALHAELGADIALPLDVCGPYPSSRDEAALDASKTGTWAERSLDCRRGEQALYGIIQGSVYPDLREAAARGIVAMGFDGYAIGGVSVGESKGEMLAAVDAVAPVLPDGEPRHLLGVGYPEDIVEAVARGIDSFDCVMPTRVARTGSALTMAGRLNLRNAAYRRDERPIEDDCPCFACRRFSRGAIRHFVKASEILGVHLLTLHNLQWMFALMARLREAILAGQFDRCRRAFLATYAGGRFHSPTLALPAR